MSRLPRIGDSVALVAPQREQIPFRVEGIGINVIELDLLEMPRTPAHQLERGTLMLEFVNEDGVARLHVSLLTGEMDIFGHAFDAVASVRAAANGTAWDGGNWMGNAWSGNAWSSDDWTGNAWSGAAWSASSWSGNAWSDGSWAGHSWTGNAWSGNAWSNSAWCGNAWSGAAWSGTAWSGSAWSAAVWE